MDQNTVLIIILIVLAALNVLLTALIISKRSRDADALERMGRELDDRLLAVKDELAEGTSRTVRNMGETMMNAEHRSAQSAEQRFATFSAENAQKLAAMQSAEELRLKTFATENEQKLENIRETVERNLKSMQADNNKKLDEMRGMVDEKLQNTLEEKLTKSFALVNERLEQVYKGLGEMQTLAAGVGDLSKVLSNVKTRGILGEIQLGAILSEIMSPEQYLTDTPVRKGASERVEFAIKLPGSDAQSVLLPIDSKFPMDAYTALTDAYESANPESVKAASEQLRARVKGFARDIRDKYICPPDTTDFAVMFLPTEGLYAEVVKLNMVETLQRDYHVNIAGPSTMAALLNSLQMGFRTLAIQKRSSEVWKVLGAVKTEFERFDKVLASAQDRLERVHGDLDTLIGVRTRKIRSTLRHVESLPETDVPALLDEADAAEDEDSNI